MFKLVIITALVAVVAAKPGYLASPVIGSVVAEKTIESHGNSVIHASAPALSYAAVSPVVHSAPLVSVHSAPSSLVYAAQPVLAEKTVSSYGHSLVHHGGPSYAHAAYVAPSYYI